MARSRNIKPAFFLNEELAELDPIDRLAFIGLWTIADYKGCLENRPKRIKATILPYDNCDIEKIMINLEQSRFIASYNIQGKPYIKIINFEKHQNPHPNERKGGSKIPDIDENNLYVIDNKEVAINHDKDVTNREEDATNRADSLLLIPDSLMSMSGKPDPKAILIFLNEKTGKKYQPVKANLNLISARLKEYSEDQLRQVIAKKCREWGTDDKMAQYLTPKTLFNATNFANYAGELV